MTREQSGLSHHPAPHGDRLSTGKAAFLLFTGPLAWFAQLCIGYGLMSWPCFPHDEKLMAPLAGYEATRAIALVLLLACAVLAAVSGFVALRTLREVKGEREGGHEDLIHIGHGRTRFTALWGAILGLGFAITTLATLAAFALVPRCAG